MHLPLPAVAPPLIRGGRGGFFPHPEAARLINGTGYHRRDAELADLKTKLST